MKSVKILRHFKLLFRGNTNLQFFSSGIIGIYTTMHSKESLSCQNAVLDGYYVWLTKHFVPEFNFSHFKFRINSLNLNL